MTYANLADVYDRFANDFDYDEWTKWYLSLIDSADKRAVSVCDCGCGTGSIAVRLAKKGKRVIGIDLSEDMLRVASDKARAWGTQIRFARQNMEALELPRPVDAIICACDGVNYLTDENKVRRFLESAYENILPGGTLAFDVSNLDKLSGMGKTYLYGEDREEATYLWTNEFNEETRQIAMRVVFFVREDDGRYRKFEETHVQRAHTVNELETWLTETGFTNICTFGSDEGEGPGPGGKRVYIKAIKPKGR